MEKKFYIEKGKAKAFFTSEDILLEKVGMLCYGVRFSDDVLHSFMRYKYKRASLSEGIFLKIKVGKDEIPVNVAGFESFARESPYSYNSIEGVLFKGNEKLFSAQIIPDPQWYSFKLTNGKPITSVIQSHGEKTLTSCLSSFCTFVKSSESCKFCAINSSEAGITDSEELIEAIKRILDEGYNYYELNLNAGTPSSPDRGAKMFSAIIEKVKKKTGLRIYLQMCPPEDVHLLEILKDAGVDSISFNLEIFDDRIREEICPGKSKIKKETYSKSFDKGVEIFGRGNVSSWIIAGLEPVDSTIKGIDFILEHSVVPFLTVFRPLIGSIFEKRKPPEPREVLPAFQYLQEKLKQKKGFHLLSKSGCVNCDCCSVLSFRN